MTVILESGYSLPGSDEPLTHARIGHAGNWLTGGTISASTTATDFFSDGPDNTLTYEKWKPTTTSGTWEYDHGSAAACDYCAVGAHDLGTSGATVKVQYHNGSSWVDLSAATAITTDEPLFFIFGTQTRQRWRLNITTASAAPTIGVIKFGAAMQFERPLYGGHAPIPLARKTVLRANYSETGEFLGRTKQRHMLATNYAWQNLTSAWIRANWPAFQQAIEEEPFFIAWRPETFGDVALCQVDAVPIPQAMGMRDLYQVEMEVRARGW